VAQLAGVPRDVILQARRYLEALESQRDRLNAAGGPGRRSPQTELPLFAPDAADIQAAADAQAAADRAFVAELRAALGALEPDSLSPRAALDAVYRLRELLAKHS
jgi:DNA mismatch repair protein MutS